MDGRKAAHNQASNVSAGAIGQFDTVNGNVTINAGQAPGRHRRERPPAPAAGSGMSPAEAARIAVHLMTLLNKQPLARIRKDGYAEVHAELGKLKPRDAAAVLRSLPHHELSGLVQGMPLPLAARVLPELGLDHLRELANKWPQVFADGRLLCYTPTADAVELLRELPSSTAMDLLGHLRRGSTGMADAEHHARQASATRIWDALNRR